VDLQPRHNGHQGPAPDGGPAVLSVRVSGKSVGSDEFDLAGLHHALSALGNRENVVAAFQGGIDEFDHPVKDANIIGELVHLASIGSPETPVDPDIGERPVVGSGRNACIHIAPEIADFSGRDGARQAGAHLGLATGGKDDERQENRGQTTQAQAVEQTGIIAEGVRGVSVSGLAAVNASEHREAPCWVTLLPNSPAPGSRQMRICFLKLRMPPGNELQAGLVFS
jgi:hypothetical protein